MHRPIYMYMLYVDMSIVYSATTAMNIRIHCMLSIVCYNPTCMQSMHSLLYRTACVSYCMHTALYRLHAYLIYWGYTRLCNAVTRMNDQ